MEEILDRARKIKEKKEELSQEEIELLLLEALLIEFMNE